MLTVSHFDPKNSRNKELNNGQGHIIGFFAKTAECYGYGYFYCTSELEEGSHGAKSAEQSENKLRIVRSQAAPCVKQDSLRLNSSKFMEMFQQILLRVKFNFIVLKCE